jgi:hypothetical protein
MCVRLFLPPSDFAHPTAPTRFDVTRTLCFASFTGEVALVSSGIRDGERVVTLGVQKLNPGEKVRAIEQP